MSVLAKNGDVYADFVGYAISRVRAFFEIAAAVMTESLEMQREMIRKYGHIE